MSEEQNQEGPTEVMLHHFPRVELDRLPCATVENIKALRVQGWDKVSTATRVERHPDGSLTLYGPAPDSAQVNTRARGQYGSRRGRPPTGQVRRISVGIFEDEVQALRELFPGNALGSSVMICFRRHLATLQKGKTALAEDLDADRRQIQTEGN